MPVTCGHILTVLVFFALYNCQYFDHTYDKISLAYITSVQIEFADALLTESDYSGSIDSLFDNDYKSCINLNTLEMKQNGIHLQMNLSEIMNVALWKIYFGGITQYPAGFTECLLTGLPFNDNGNGEELTMVGVSQQTLLSPFLYSTLFQSQEPTNSTNVSLTGDWTWLDLYIGATGSPAEDQNWTLCSVDIMARTYTPAPTDSPTQDPTHTPSMDTNVPTIVPTINPTLEPTSMPTLPPTVDQCPNKMISQSCCASFVSPYSLNTFTYNTDGQLMMFDNETAKYDYCSVHLTNVTCCGNGTYEFESVLDSSVTELECINMVNGTQVTLARGNVSMCNASFLLNDEQSLYYSFLELNSSNSYYDKYDIICLCEHYLWRCVDRIEPICNNSDVPFNGTCAVTSDMNPFIGSGVTIENGYDLQYNDSTNECKCEYEIDVEQCVTVGTQDEDYDACTVDYVQYCCSDGMFDIELRDNRIALHSLTLTDIKSYSSDINELGNSTLICSNDDNICVHPSSSSVGPQTNIYLSYWMDISNTTTTTNIMNSECLCRYSWYNCSTQYPSTYPSNIPTNHPTVVPTVVPTVYHSQDFQYSFISEQCCNGSSMSFSSVSSRYICDNQNALCDQSYANAESDAITVAFVNDSNSSSCTCTYSVGYWDWSAYVDGTDVPSTIWIIATANLSWSTDYDYDNAVSSIGSCLKMFIDQCDSSSLMCNTTTTTNGNISGYISVDVAQSLQIIEDVIHCYCYRLYVSGICSPSAYPTLPPTASTISPTSHPIGVSDEGFVDSAQQFVEDNMMWVIIAVSFLVPLCLACIVVIIIKCKKRKKKRKKLKAMSASTTTKGGKQQVYTHSY